MEEYRGRGNDENESKKAEDHCRDHCGIADCGDDRSDGTGIFDVGRTDDFHGENQYRFWREHVIADVDAVCHKQRTGFCRKGDLPGDTGGCLY